MTKFWLLFFMLSSTLSAAAQAVVIGTGSEETILTGAQIIVAPASIDVSGGRLTINGTSAASPGLLTSGVTAGVNLNVLPGGTIDFKYAKLESILSVVVSAGGKVTRIHDTVFTDLAGLNPGATPWINLAALGSSDRAGLPFSFNRVSFIDPQGSPTRKNIQAGVTTPLLRLLGNAAAHGNRWGNGFDVDTANVILWNTGQVTRTSPAGTFDTIEDGLKDAATAAGSTFTVALGALGFIDDVCDFSTLPSNVANGSGPIVKNACLAPMTGKAVFDGDVDTTPRGMLVNCVVARGAIEETTAENCTFFDPFSVVTLNFVTGTNCLVQNGFAGGNNTLINHCLTTASPTLFSNAAAFDFHLVGTATSAIDQGTTTSANTDFDGETRTAPFDIGADEAIAPTMVTVTHKTRDTKPNLSVSGITGYTVGFYRNGVLMGTAVVSGGTASFEDPTVQTDGNYSYTAAYQLSGGGTGASNGAAVITIDTVPPAAPGEIVITPRDTVIDVEWIASPSADVVGYRVFMSTNGGAYVDQFPGQLVVGTKCRISGLVNGTTYSFKVSASDGALPQ